MWLMKSLIIFFFLFYVENCEYNHRPAKQNFKFSFEQDADLNLINWKCHTLFALSDSISLEGPHSLKVTFFPSIEEAYPGFSIGAFKRNWEERDTLIFNIFNPAQDSLRFILRIDDSDNPTYVDRYNHGFRLPTGWTTIRLPLNTLRTSGSNRILKSNTIQALIFFFANLDQKRTLCFDDFKIDRFKAQR